MSQFATINFNGISAGNLSVITAGSAASTQQINVNGIVITRDELEVLAYKKRLELKKYNKISKGIDVKLTEKEYLFLKDFFNTCNCYYDYWRFPFQSMQDKLDNKLKINEIRLICRSLARKGIFEFTRGLLDEDGQVAGSGYGLTKYGYEWCEKNGF